MNPSQRTPLKKASHTKASRGQVLVIFAGTLTVLLLMAALVVDLAWLWSNSLRIQRAADAAALAGVTHLPGDTAGAYLAAKSGATRNGYTTGTGGVTVTPLQDATSPRRLDVKVTAPVKTFFLHLIGMDTVIVSRKSKAEFILPVPMGSPLNYYGIYGQLRTSAGGTWVDQDGDTSPAKPASATKGTNTWSSTGNAYVSDNAYAFSTTTGQQQAWGNFGFTVPSGATIRGVSVEVESKTNDAGCQFRATLSWNNGSTYTSGTSGSDPGIKVATLTTADAMYTLGSASQTWGRTWADTEFSNANFRVRLENFDPGAACATNSRIDVDRIRATVYYTTAVWVPDANVAGPAGEVLAPQGFWGEMLSQGANTSSGDAYLPFYVEASASKVNPEQNVGARYDYAVEMQAGSSGGKVYIFDPGFCDQGSFYLGTGDNYYTGSGAVSAFYQLYDTQGTLYDLADDRLVGSSGNTFRRESVTCDAYHNTWYQMPMTSAPESVSGMSAGGAAHVYRLRTYTYDSTDVAGQKAVSANNSYGLFAKGTSGLAPKIYGIGAMEMFTPLPALQTSTFYLAQIEAVHADKTMEIRLWDPGDTNMDAYIQILKPTTSGWTAVTDMAYTAKRGQLNPATGTYIFNSGASTCDSNSSSSTDRVQTYQGSPKFNGCWLTIDIRIPANYTAPQSGWWKISYTMQGSAGTNASDITTWQVDIRGNPVHLVEP
jgi:hypothetical protein